MVYSNDVKLMVKGLDKLGYGLVRAGCAPPRLTLTVEYKLSSQVSAAFPKATQKLLQRHPNAPL